MNTTPKDVFEELKKQQLPYGLFKDGGFWYVVGGESYMWHETCLYTRTFKTKPAKYWADEIKNMELANKEKVQS